MKSHAKLQKLIKDFYPFAQKRLHLTRRPTIKLVDDRENAQDIWGSTGSYEPESKTIIIYTTGRLLKDCLRSLSHELVHFSQDLRGAFKDKFSTEDGYAQNDSKLRKLEEEAYLQGNLILRDFEDQIKKNRKTTSTPVRSMPLEEVVQKKNELLYERLKPRKNIIQEEREQNSNIDWNLVKLLKNKISGSTSEEDLIMYAMTYGKMARDGSRYYLNLAKELQIGSNIEMQEHHVDQKEAEQIAIDHMQEHVWYYTKLQKVELS